LRAGEKEIKRYVEEIRELKNKNYKEDNLMKKITMAMVMVFVVALTAFAEDKVKDFTFKTIDGGTIAYSSLRGSPIVVNVAAAW
jgi:hypothetical protein